jgi:predicted DNA-binding transcriptional regulator AlpA
MRLLMSFSDNIPKKQAARIVGVSESTIVRLVKTDDFPKPFKIGGRTFYSEIEIRTWIEVRKNTRLDA